VARSLKHDERIEVESYCEDLKEIRDKTWILVNKTVAIENERDRLELEFRTIISKIKEWISDSNAERSAKLVGLELIQNQKCGLELSENLEKYGHKLTMICINDVEVIETTIAEVKKSIEITLKGCQDDLHHKLNVLTVENHELLCKASLATEKLICQICFDNEMDVFLKDCGHTMCMSCVSKLVKPLCPFCTKRFRKAKKLYFMQ